MSTSVQTEIRLLPQKTYFSELSSDFSPFLFASFVNIAVATTSLSSEDSLLVCLFI